MKTKNFISKRRISEDFGGVSAPMSTPMNTPGMGNPTPPGPGKIGSGDNWGGSINKVPHTQKNIDITKTKRKKRNKKNKIKLVKESLYGK